MTKSQDELRNELLSELTESTGPSSAIDWKLCEFAHLLPVHMAEDSIKEIGVWYRDGYRLKKNVDRYGNETLIQSEYWTPPAFTKSVDECFRLAATFAPGWMWGRLSQGDSGKWWTEMREGYITSYNRVMIGEHQLLTHAMLKTIINTQKPR